MTKIIKIHGRRIAKIETMLKVANLCRGKLTTNEIAGKLGFDRNYVWQLIYKIKNL